MILAVIGWFFLALLALFVLLMVVPLTIGIRYGENQLTIWVRILFIRLRIFPLKPKKPQPEEKTAEPKPEKEAKPKKPAKEKPKKTFGEIAALVKRLIRAGRAAIAVFFHHFRISSIRIVLPVHTAEAADTALLCGKIQAAIGTTRALADGRLNLSFKQIEIIPDFSGQLGQTRHFSCKMWFCPGIIFPMAIRFLVVYLKKRPYSKKAYKRALREKQAARAQRQNGKAA